LLHQPSAVALAAHNGELFGWQFRPGSVEHGLQVDGPTPQTGMWGGSGRPNVTLMYRVDDIATAVVTVRALGGEASDQAQMPYGVTSDCVDDQGMAFSLGQL
jgi:predicted enzyme related to lactoylglutathione lyase